MSKSTLLALAALLFSMQAAFATRGAAFHPAATHDKAGRAVLMTAGNGQTTNNTYDALGRLTDRTLFQTPAMQETEVLVQLGWDHDAAGNVLAQHETWPGEASRGTGIRSTLMGYDDNYRLTSETIQTRASPAAQPVDQSSTAYTYDDANNRVTKTVTRLAASSTDAGENDVGHWVFGYNEANQLTSWEKWDAPAGTLIQSAELTYDANGNRETLSVTTFNTQPETLNTTYTWDALDRLSSVTLPDGTQHTYTYDHRTRRIGLLEDNGTLAKHTALTFAGGLSTAEWETEDDPSTLNLSTINPTVEYQRGPDMGGGVGGLLYTRVGDFQSPTLRYNLSNGRGDIIAQSDATATLTWTASYEAGGKRPIETGTNPDKQRGNSKDEDPTGLLNEHYRYRELEHMVWLSRDPAGFVDGLNLYSYVRQNPWSKFDPLGLNDAAIFMEEAGAQSPEARAAMKEFDGKIFSGLASTPRALKNGLQNLPKVPGQLLEAAMSPIQTLKNIKHEAIETLKDPENLGEFFGTSIVGGGLLSKLTRARVPVTTRPGGAPEAPPPPPPAPALTASSSITLANAEQAAMMAAPEVYSGVFHPQTGFGIMRPSSSLPDLPPGWVPRRAGHARVAAEAVLEKGMPFEELQGFTAFDKGKLWEVEFKSALNSPNMVPGTVLPPKSRWAILEAIEETTQKQAKGTSAH